MLAGLHVDSHVKKSHVRLTCKMCDSYIIVKTTDTKPLHAIIAWYNEHRNCCLHTDIEDYQLSETLSEIAQELQWSDHALNNMMLRYIIDLAQRCGINNLTDDIKLFSVARALNERLY